PVAFDKLRLSGCGAWSRYCLDPPRNRTNRLVDLIRRWRHAAIRASGTGANRIRERADMATVELARDSREERNAARLQRLRTEDAQYQAATQLEAVTALKRTPGIRFAQVVAGVMEGYADRPALGQRARELVTDPATGRSTLKLLPRFDTRTYREVWAR